MAFTGFESSDFDAFVPKKRKSNAYTLERRKVKDKLWTLVKDLEPSVATEARGFVLESTEDAPSVTNGRSVSSISVYWIRPPSERAHIKGTTELQAQTIFQIAAHHQHPHTFMELGETSFRLGFRLPDGAHVDRVNAAEKLRLGWAFEEWREEIEGWSEEVRFGTSERSIPWTQHSTESFRTLADVVEAGSGLQATREIEREVCLSLGGDLVNAVETNIRASLRCHRFFAWSKANDHSPLEQSVEEAMETKRVEQPSFAPGQRVTILGGLFAGRAGYLAEVDPKGKAKVMVGPVSVSVALEDLKGAGG